MDKEESDVVKKCAKEYKLKRSELSKLFLAYPTNLNDDAADYLVVPISSKYFCSGLHGAHSIAIWAIVGDIVYGKETFVVAMHTYNDKLYAHRYFLREIKR